MIRGFRDRMRKGYNSVAKLERADMKPTAFKTNLSDLGKMHNLRLWYIQNSPNTGKRYDYLGEVETLHDEINYMAQLKVQKRMFLLTLGLLGYYFLWLESDGDKYDFSEDYDSKQMTRSFANLEDGGFEVVI